MMMTTRDTASTVTWLIAVIMIYCVSSHCSGVSYLPVTLDWAVDGQHFPTTTTLTYYRHPHLMTTTVNPP